jgi:hypothetical protein
MNKNLTPAEVVTLLFRAKEAANAHSSAPDEGTCNFDAVVLRSGKRTGTYKKLLDMCQIGYFESELRGKKALFLSGLYDGQGVRRTRMMEAAYEVLAQGGLDVVPYYMVD